MWGKREQVVLWATAYLPLMLIMFYRYIDSNDYFKSTDWAQWLAGHFDKTIFDIMVILAILIFSLLAYRLVANWLFSKYDSQLKDRKLGTRVWVRKYERLSVNDYSFFLLTLLLPLISMDYASVINLMITLVVVVIVIVIYVKTGTISVCPVFFVSGRQVYKAVLSDKSKAAEAVDPSVRQEAVIITREKFLNLNRNFRTVKLLNNIYYLTANRQGEDPFEEFSE